MSEDSLGESSVIRLPHKVHQESFSQKCNYADHSVWEISYDNWWGI